MITEEEYLKAKKIVEEYEEQEFKAITIKFGVDERCLCDCATPCPLGKSGMAYRCTKEELSQAGYET